MQLKNFAKRETSPPDISGHLTFVKVIMMLYLTFLITLGALKVIGMQDGGGLDPRIPKIYNTLGLWWIVLEIWFWGLEHP